MKKLLISIILLVTSGLGLAASNSQGLVSSPLATEQGAVMFGVVDGGTFGGTKPACSTMPN